MCQSFDVDSDDQPTMLPKQQDGQGGGPRVCRLRDVLAVPLLETSQGHWIPLVPVGYAPADAPSSCETCTDQCWAHTSGTWPVAKERDFECIVHEDTSIDCYCATVTRRESVRTLICTGLAGGLRRLLASPLLVLDMSEETEDGSTATEECEVGFDETVELTETTATVRGELICLNRTDLRSGKTRRSAYRFQAGRFLKARSAAFTGQPEGD